MQAFVSNRVVSGLGHGMLALMRKYAWIAVPVLWLSIGCEDKPTVEPTAPPPPAPSAPEVDKQPKRETVSDFDVKDLQQDFGCPNKTNQEVCGVLEGFAKGEPWNLTSIRGKDARFFGKAIARENGELKERWVFLIAKKVPLNEVTQGDLPLQVALRQLDDSQVAENNHAEKLLGLLSRDDAVTKRNQTANYVVGYAPSKWDSAAETKGKSVILHVGDGAYVRQGEAQTLHLVKLDAAKPGASSVDGLFVQLYPLSW